jgi:hypothetical protein
LSIRLPQFVVDARTVEISDLAIISGAVEHDVSVSIKEAGRRIASCGTGPFSESVVSIADNLTTGPAAGFTLNDSELFLREVVCLADNPNCE